MYKQFLLWGLQWLQKRIASMSDEQIMALDEKVDTILKIDQGSKQDEKIDNIVKTVFPFIREFVKHI